MKIIMVDKYYFVKGGAERYMFELAEILVANGHQVIPFSMKHPHNHETAYESFFADNIEFNAHSRLQAAVTAVKSMGRMIYSNHVQKRLQKLLAAERPDIAHLHMIDHQLSPSVLVALKNHGIPVIQTIHHYKLVCPNYKLFNPRAQKICEKCLSGNFYHPIIERCHKDSVIASAMIAVESAVHRWLRLYEKNVDLFHVPSRFMGQKMHEGGVGNGKTRHLFYTIKMDKFQPIYENKGYMLYLGRLSEEKGLRTLLAAMKKMPGVQLAVVGDGPMEHELHTYVGRHDLRNVKFFGKKSGEELQSLLTQCNFLVVPSEWHDNSPLVIYEAFAYGKPVVCSRLGGMPELVDDGETGLLFNAGDVEQLVYCIRRLWDNPGLTVAYGKAARAKAEREFDPQAHYKKMYEWYQELAGQVRVRV